MSYNTYRGIETCRNSMGDAIEQLQKLVDDGPDAINEYETRALKSLINGAIDIIELYFEAVQLEYTNTSGVEIDRLISNCEAHASEQGL
jgi:hypothetical protein